MVLKGPFASGYSYVVGHPYRCYVMRYPRHLQKMLLPSFAWVENHFLILPLLSKPLDKTSVVTRSLQYNAWMLRIFNSYRSLGHMNCVLRLHIYNSNSRLILGLYFVYGVIHKSCGRGCQMSILLHKPH